MAWTKLRADGSETWQPGTRAAFEGREIVESKVFFAKAQAYVSLEPPSSEVLGGNGDPIEILFQDHPSQLQAGKGFAIILSGFGKPVAGHKIQVFADRSQGHDPIQSSTTDEKGACEVLIETPGRYLLTARREGSTPEVPESDGFSYSIAVALEIGPRQQSD